MSDIVQSIRGFIVENFLYGQPDTFGDDESFLQLGMIDSTGALELVGFVEREFKITIEDHELVPENLDSVNQLLRFIQSKRVCANTAS